MDRGYSHRQRPKSSGGISHRTAAMREFTAQHSTEFEDPSRHAPEEYLNKYGLSAYFKDVMTLVLENRPHDPIDFITEYYRNCAQGSSYLHRSYRYIRLTERNNDVFMDNLYMSYKSLSRRKGSIGATGEEMSKLLTLLCHDFPPDVSSNILRRLGRRAADVVTFEEFALATKACLLYEEFFEIAEEVFEFASIECGPSDDGEEEEEEGNNNIVYTSSPSSLSRNSSGGINNTKSSIEKIGGKCPDLISSNATPHNVTIENRWYQMQRVLNTPDVRGTFASDKIDMKNLSSANGSGKLPSSFSTLSSSDNNNNNSDNALKSVNENDNSNDNDNDNSSSKTNDTMNSSKPTGSVINNNNNRLNKRVNAKKFVNLLRDTILKMSIMENNLHANNNIDSNSSISSSPMSPLSASLIFPSLKVLERKVANAASSHPLGNITLQEFARCVFEMTKMENNNIHK